MNNKVMEAMKMQFVTGSIAPVFNILKGRF